MALEDLFDEITALPDRIYAEERKLIEMQHKLEEQRFLLKNAEANLLSQDFGPISGKNEQVRQAQLHQRTAPERVQLLEYETAARLQQAKVEWLRDMLTAYNIATRVKE